MKKKYRLIEDFKKQTQTTIWKHLDAMAVNYAVYSTQQCDLSPFLTDYAVYLYCTDSCMVVVCLDRCGHCKEQEYAESRTLGPLIYNPGQEPRVSIVWKLAQAVKAIRNRLQIPVYGVLITEAIITNADALYSMWDSNNVMVIDDMKNMKFHYIWVNHDDDLDCKSFVDNLLSTPLQISDAECDACSTPSTTETHPAEVNLFDDEFEQLLKEFINGASTDTDEKAIDDSASSSDCKSVESPSDTADESPAEEEETPPFPDGEIEQNPNLTVKVEVLRPMPNPREELEKLVGCAEIKQRMDELVNLTAYNQILQRSCPAAKQHAVSLHSLFLGRPGTGKTTVCKIFGSLLHQAGALSKGHVVVCDRGTFIGTLWGDEERAMRQLIDLAKGGVLMIDEAYLLNSANENDPGKIVLQLLMNTLADESQRDIAIVLCGYKEPMTQLLELNPGFQSRFPNRFEFPDFTIEELLEITKHRVHDYRYRFTKKAWEKYVAVLSDAFQVRDPLTWGNARFVGNLLERIYLQHATRCVKQQVKGKSALLSLIPEDIVPIEVPRQRKKLGF